MKTIDDAIYYALNKDKKSDKIKCIDVPNYYNVLQMANSMYSNLSDILPRKLDKKEITFICTTYDAFRILNKNEFNAIYLYDYFDFTDKNYYVLKELPRTIYNVLESADNISGSLIKEIVDNLINIATLYIFHDSYIPRRYSGEGDIYFISNLTTYNIDSLHNNKSFHSTEIQSFLNKLRNRRNPLQNIISNAPKQKVELIECAEFKLSDVDITRPIITPHPPIVRKLNPAIRNYLGIIDYEDPVKPLTNEYLISHGPSIAIIGNKEITLPIGYRLKVKQVLDIPKKRNNVYDIIFDYEYPDGNIEEATITISKSYLEYLVNGITNLRHHPQSYLYYYGYVIGDYYFINNHIECADILYDYTLSNEKRDLYTSLLPVANEVRIYYNLSHKIKFKDE